MTAFHVEIDRIRRPRTPRRRAVLPLHQARLAGRRRRRHARRRNRAVQGLWARQHRVRRADRAKDALSHRLGQQAVHGERGADAGRGRQAQALRSAAQVSQGAEAAARHHRPDDAQCERPARLPRAAAAGRPRPRQAGAPGRSSGRLRAQQSSQLRAGQPLPLQQQQLPAARPDHREAGRHEAGRLPRRAHLQAARHDQHPAGARDRHGDPGSRHGLSRRLRGRLPPRRARLPAGRRRRPHLDRRGPADLEPAFRPAGAVAQGPAGATRGRGAAHRRPCQQVSPRRAGRRHARPRHARSWRPVAGLSHGIPARAAGRPHRRGDRQSGQHRSVAAVARHRDAGAGRRQAAEARLARHHARPRSSRSPAPGSTPRSRRCSTWRGATARRR